MTPWDRERWHELWTTWMRFPHITRINERPMKCEIVCVLRTMAKTNHWGNVFFVKRR